MSTIGPMTRATRPTPGVSAVLAVSSPVVAGMSGLASFVRSRAPSGAVSCGRCSRGGSEGVGARHDLADLLGDLTLAGLVGQPRVHADQVLGVLGRGVHRTLPGGELGRCGLEQA